MVTLLTRRGAEVHAGEMPNTPDPEVPEQAKRRRFTAAYKARILAAADACSEPGQIGAPTLRDQVECIVGDCRDKRLGEIPRPGRKCAPSH